MEGAASAAVRGSVRSELHPDIPKSGALSKTTGGRARHSDDCLWLWVPFRRVFARNEAPVSHSPWEVWMMTGVIRVSGV